MSEDDDVKTNLDDSLKETLDEIHSRDTEEVEDVDEVEDEEIEETDSLEARARDDKGRFKPKEPTDEASEEETEVDEGDEAQLDSDLGEPVDEPQEEEKSDFGNLKVPPSGWRPQAKAKWKDLPAEVREDVLKRENDMIKGANNLRDSFNYAQQMKEVINPYMPMIQSQGSTPERVVQGMLNTVYRLQSGTPQEKAQVFMQTAQQFGVDLSLLQQPKDGQAPQGNNAMQPYIGKIQQLEQQLYQIQQRDKQAETNSATQQIKDFSNAVDETGNQRYPYFENVRTQMALAIDAAEQQGQTLTLEKAYDAAVWANPDTRPLVLAEQSQSEQVKRQSQAKEKASRALKAGKVNLKKSAEHTSTPLKPTGTLDDTMTETLAKVKARA